MRLKNILVPHAGSAGGDKALLKAVYLSKLSGATINILHVVEPLQRPPIFSFSTAERKKLQKEFEKTTSDVQKQMKIEMKKRVKLCHSKNINATYQVTIGLPEKEIIKFAKYYGSDLIIMAKRRKLPRFKGILKLGSVSRKILEVAKRPVLMINA